MSEITQTQVKSFYKNGFLVLKNIIPKDIVIQAKHNIDISEEFNNQVKNYNNQTLIHFYIKNILIIIILYSLIYLTNQI